MNIGSISGSRLSFSSQSLKVADNSSDSTAELKKQLTSQGKQQSSTASSASAGGRPPGGPPPGGIHGGPPKELSKSDLEQLKSQISESDEEGAKKLDELINNFDKYDNGTGTISADQFKSYAQDNGISLPERKQKHQPEYQGPLSSVEEGEESDSTAVIKKSAASVLSKYTSGSSTSSDSSSDSSDYSSMTTAQLQKLASSGDAEAQAEIDKRKSSSSSEDTSNSSSVSLDIAA